jgi:hypothetical protein
VDAPILRVLTVLAISMMQRAAFSESPKGRLLASFVPG